MEFRQWTLAPTPENLGPAGSAGWSSLESG